MSPEEHLPLKFTPDAHQVLSVKVFGFERLPYLIGFEKPLPVIIEVLKECGQSARPSPFEPSSIRIIVYLTIGKDRQS